MSIDPDELVEDDPFCPAIIGPGVHNFQPLIDIMAGKTILYCTQCGDTLEVYSLPAGSNPFAQPAASSPSVQPAPSNPFGPGGPLFPSGNAAP